MKEAAKNKIINNLWLLPHHLKALQIVATITSPPSSAEPLPKPTEAGITEPVNENPRTALPLAETVKPFASASPPPAPVTQPL